MRIAVAQFSAARSKDENLNKIISFIEKAASKNVDLIVFPEYSMIYPLPKENPSIIAEPINGPFTSKIIDEAKNYNINVVVNICEECIEEPNKIYDTSILISNKGEILLTYRKTHLFDAFKFRESRIIKPGNIIPNPVKINEFNVGLLICYDIRFPEAIRVLALKGCNLLCISSAWFAGNMKEEHLLTTLRSRAIENGIYIAIANQTGPTFCGRSSIIDPFGVKLVDAGEEETLVYTDIKIERVEKIRKILPLLKQRRPELYAEITQF